MWERRSGLKHYKGAFVHRVVLMAVMTATLWAETVYTNCDFVFGPYEEICKSAVKKGVSYQYANEILLSNRAKLRDEKSFKLFLPKHIAVHHANEKRANNALVSYVPQIVEHLQQYAEVYDLAEERYGVDREIIAAILMKETRLGKIAPKHDAFVVFNTLVRELKEDSARNTRLMSMAKENLVEIISYCHDVGLAPEACRFASSYAGAVGIPQFMPQNFIYIRGYRKAFGDLNIMEDAILSAAKFLKYATGYEGLIDWKQIPDMDSLENAWYEYDFTHEDASFVYEQGKDNRRYNCFTCKDATLDYTRGVVKKIMGYNNSSNYGVGVLRLAYDAHEGLMKSSSKERAALPAQ